MKQEKRVRTIRNTYYWLKKLYHDAPTFVWLYLLQIPILIGISLLGAYLPSVLVENITDGEGIAVIIQNIFLLGGGLLLLYVGNEWISRTQRCKQTKIGYQYIQDIVKQVMETDYSKIENAKFQEDFKKMQDYYLWSESGIYIEGFLSLFVSMTTAFVGMILYTGMLSNVSVWILIVVIVGTLISYYVGICCNRWEAKNRHKWIDIDVKTAYLSKEFSSFESAKDVRLYHMAPWLHKKYNQELKQRLKYTVKMQANYYLEGFVNSLVQMIWEAIAYIYLIRCVFDGTLNVGDFVFYFGIITGFASWCRSIFGGMKKLNQFAFYIEEDKTFRKRIEKESEEGKKEFKLKENQKVEITFRNVSFCYEGEEKPTIENLNLILRAGENIAVVGANGAGKTTLIKLLCGFYKPTKGEILINGVNRNNYSTTSVLKYFSGVFQDKNFFPISLQENLVFSEKADEKCLWNCLKLADIDTKVKSLSNGLHTNLGVGVQEDAVEFSGGEEQKLLLARSLYKEAPILILDEPTAALDPLMESELYEKYSEFSKGKTTIFISHRLASTKFCDRILLMKDGKIVEEGTHDVLVKKDGVYAKMFEVQSQYYKKKQVIAEEV